MISAHPYRRPTCAGFNVMVTASDRFTEPGLARFFGPDDVIEGGGEPVVFPDILVPHEHRTLMRDKTLPVPHLHVKGYVFDRYEPGVGQYWLTFGNARDLSCLPLSFGFFVAVLVPLPDDIL
jgi:hypothetical protein